MCVKVYQFLQSTLQYLAMSLLSFFKNLTAKLTVYISVIGLFAAVFICSLVTQVQAQTSTDPIPIESANKVQSNQLNDRQIILYLPIPAEPYKQLLAELRKALDKARLTSIKIKTAEHWVQYQQAIRDGNFGVFFTAPHYTAWSIHEKGFRPLLRLNKQLKYVIAVERSKREFFEINDLIDSQICTQRALNLDYLLVSHAFENRLLSASGRQLWSVTEALHNKQSKCDAYSISEHNFIEFERSNPNKLIRLKQGNTYTNYAYIAHPKVTTRIRRKLSEFLSARQNIVLLSPIYQLFADQSKLVPASKADYPQNYADILRQYW